MRVHVISLWQPWATLVVSGAKRIETRSWYPRGLRPGTLIAVHAAKRWTDEEQEMCEYDPFYKRYLALASRRGLWNDEHPPLGGIVGVATYRGVQRTEAILRTHHNHFHTVPNPIPRHELAFGNYQFGRWGWLLEDAKPLPFTALRGQQGLFTWEMPEE